MNAQIFLVAILLDQALGDPKNFPHPVILIGKIIDFWRKIFLTDTHSFIQGLAVCIMTLTTTGLLVFIILYISDCNFLVQVYLLYSALAWRDLKDETAKVVEALMRKNFPEARKYLSFVVGRDTQNLNETEILRALIETIAENSVDGVFSVMFFAIIGQFINASYGMALCVWIFKVASTLDSMIGYETFHEFGTASARLDDILNFLPARLGGIIIILAGALTFCNVKRAMKVFLNDRLKHKSPNSAYGESAFAGVLDVRLGGGAFYSGKLEPRPSINPEGREPEIVDVTRAWELLDVSCSLFAFVIISLSCKI